MQNTDHIFQIHKKQQQLDRYTMEYNYDLYPTAWADQSAALWYI